MTRQILIILLLAASGAGCWAQSIDQATITWHVSRNQNVSTAEDIVRPGSIISSPTNIQWLQKEGSFVYNFTVTGTSGHWPTLTEGGEFTFNVTFRNYPGTIRFARRQGQLTIEMDIRKNGVNTLPYIFHVTHTSY